MPSCHFGSASHSWCAAPGQLQARQSLVCPADNTDLPMRAVQRVATAIGHKRTPSMPIYLGMLVTWWRKSAHCRQSQAAQCYEQVQCLPVLGERDCSKASPEHDPSGRRRAGTTPVCKTAQASACLLGANNDLRDATGACSWANTMAASQQLPGAAAAQPNAAAGHSAAAVSGHASEFAFFSSRCMQLTSAACACCGRGQARSCTLTAPVCFASAHST